MPIALGRENSTRISLAMTKSRTVTTVLPDRGCLITEIERKMVNFWAKITGILKPAGTVQSTIDAPEMAKGEPSFVLFTRIS